MVPTVSLFLGSNVMAIGKLDLNVHCLPANEKGAFIKEPQHQDPPFILVPLYPHASFFEICTPGAMHLYLSSPSALNSFYSTETGRPLYKVETPLISVGETRRTIIRRAVDTVDGVWLGEKEKKSDSEDLNNALISYVQTRCVSPTSTTTRSSSDSRNDGTFEGHFAHLAHIEYALLKSSRILYAGHELRTDKLFQPKGWTWYGMSRHQVFRASDGCEYRWVINSKYPKLVSNDSSKTVIARFHRAKSSFSLRPDFQQRPSLEIYPEGEHILDDILVTFVYLRDAEEN